MFIIYVAEDGALFDNAKDCRNRELALAMAEGIKKHTLILFNNVINKSFSATDLLYEKDVIAVINKYTDYFYCEDTELFRKMIDAGAEKISGLFSLTSLPLEPRKRALGKRNRRNEKMSISIKV